MLVFTFSVFVKFSAAVAATRNAYLFHKHVCTILLRMGVTRLFFKSLEHQSTLGVTIKLFQASWRCNAANVMFKLKKHKRNFLTTI